MLWASWGVGDTVRGKTPAQAWAWDGGEVMLIRDQALRILRISTHLVTNGVTLSITRGRVAPISVRVSASLMLGQWLNNRKSIRSAPSQ